MLGKREINEHLAEWDLREKRGETRQAATWREGAEVVPDKGCATIKKSGVFRGAGWHEVLEGAAPGLKLEGGR